MWLLAQSTNGVDEPALPDPAGSLPEALRGDSEAILTLFQAYALPLIWAIIILIASMIVGKILSSGLRRTMTRAKVEQTLARFFGKLLYYLVLVLGSVFALSKFGIDVTALAAILAAVGFAVGMALSGTLSNFASGVMLLIFRPFRVGDVVDLSGVVGKVDEIELFTTTLDTPDNRRIIVPNGSIYGSTIENITYHAERRVDVNVGVEYAADIDRTRQVLAEAAESLSEKMITGEGRGFQIYLLDLGDSSVNWVVRFWTKTPDFWAVKEQLTRAVKRHLDDANIGIPFPQMDVHLDGGLRNDGVKTAAQSAASSTTAS